jgi:hypothetical protein
MSIRVQDPPKTHDFTSISWKLRVTQKSNIGEHSFRGPLSKQGLDEQMKEHWPKSVRRFRITFFRRLLVY